MNLKIKNRLRSLYYFKSYRKFKEKGNNLIFSKGGVFIRPQEISFGSNIFISRNFHISARNLLFGNDIMIGPNLVIECDNHIINIIGKRMFEIRAVRKGSFVKIEDDVWIGANVTILADVKVGEGVVIGAGSVVTKSLPPYVVCAGVPCRPIKSRFSSKNDLKEHIQTVQSKLSIEEILTNWRQLGFNKI